MTSSFLGFGALFFALPMLVCQWLGIFGLSKINRNASWWCMVVGAGASTLGSIGSSVFVVLMMMNLSSFGSSGGMLPIAAISGFSGLGSLLFYIGFAIHGMQASNGQKRISELEAIANAQDEELQRLRANQ